MKIVSMPGIMHGSMRLLVGSTNKGKIIEIGEALKGLPLSLTDPAAAGIMGSPEEHGTTYAENALAKARFYASASSLPAIADDSGIKVEALVGELGIHTRRWGAGAEASDAAWIDFFLKRMEREKNRRARFVCMIAYIDDAGAEHLFEGVCDGVITQSIEAAYLPGLPISACFKPDGFDRVYSALTVEQKNSTSHRGRALKGFRSYLEGVMGH
jgi:XTP/dITP diphosphohydrolase